MLGSKELCLSYGQDFLEATSHVEGPEPSRERRVPMGSLGLNWRCSLPIAVILGELTNTGGAWRCRSET